jgi:hypothetical protein
MSRVATLASLVQAIGLEPALVLVAWAGGKTVFVPEKYRAGHLLERVLGESAFLGLIAGYGGETLSLTQSTMDPERRLGAVMRGMRAGLTTRQIADQIGVTFRRVRQIETAIKAGGPLTPLARNQKPPLPSAERSP